MKAGLFLFKETKVHRIFAALAVPEHEADRLLALREDVPGARWRRRDHFHITLHFYGEVQRDLAEEIAASLEHVTAMPLNLEINGVGWFGRKAPHALYARIADTPELTQLAAACRKIARRLKLKIDEKPFRPHITLAYCHETPLADARDWSERYQNLRSEPFNLSQFALYESFTSPGQQSRYTPQADYLLGG